MKPIAIIAALLLSAPAYAGSFDPATTDPTVIAPQCVWFGFIRCHVGFDYDEPGGDEPLQISLPEPEPQPEPKGKCK